MLQEIRGLVRSVVRDEGYGTREAIELLAACLVSNFYRVRGGLQEICGLVRSVILATDMSQVCERGRACDKGRG